MSQNIRAIILAAGEGTRLRPYTEDRPKCLVELAGKPLLIHQIDRMKQLGIKEITVVTGYLAHKIEDLGFSTKYNPAYNSTNMVATMMCASDLFTGESDLLIAYSDIVYNENVLKPLLENPAPLSTTVDKNWLSLWQLRAEDPMEDAETLKIDKDRNILELGKKPSSLKEIEAQYMGIIKVRADFAKEFISYYSELSQDEVYDGKDKNNMYMTSFLQHIIDSGQSLNATIISGGWLEVDTKEDLDQYNTMFENGKLSIYWTPQE